MGTDRNNDAVSALYDERNLAVKRAIRHLIKTAHKDGKTVSICGQAPSEYPDFTEFLVKSGIDYVSVNPDMVKETKLNVAHFEQRILLDKATGLGMQDTEDYEWYLDLFDHKSLRKERLFCWIIAKIKHFMTIWRKFKNELS